MVHREIGGGWHKEHDYTIEVAAIEKQDSAEGRRYWAAISVVLRSSPDSEHGGTETQGWPDQRFYGQTEAEALHAADVAVKLWIDVQDEARWSGNQAARS